MSRRDDRGMLAAQQAVVRLLRDRYAVTDPIVLEVAGLVVRAVGRGHTGVDLARTDEELVRLLDVADDALAGLPPRDAVLAALRDCPAVAVVTGRDDVARDRPLVLDGTLVATERTHRLERRVLAALARRRAAVVDDTLDMDAMGATLVGASEDQAEAVRTLLRTNRAAGLGVLVGGPGTGKTTTVATLLGALQAEAIRSDAGPLHIAMAAPTGKAAARLGESLAGAIGRIRGEGAGGLGPGLDAIEGLRARTVHRLLGIGRDGVARRDPGPLPYDVVIVDEVSMLDLALTAELLDALDDGCRLFLVGDQYQLQSVGVGSVLQSLVDGLTGQGPDAEAVPVARLTKNHRLEESADPEHLTFVARTREGDADGALEALDALSERRGDAGTLRLVVAPDPTAEVDEVLAIVQPTVEVAREQLRSGSDLATVLAALEGARVLCAHRAGPWGVERWWSLLRAGLTERTGRGPIGGRVWLEGEPVLATVNDPTTGLSNGDTGIVVDAGGAPRFAFALPDGAVVDRPVVAMPDVQSALAVTVHKSQGSEYGTVVVVLPPDTSRLATRELLYTAVTRARERVVLIGERDALHAAIQRRSVRMGGLVTDLHADRVASSVSG